MTISEQEAQRYVAGYSQEDAELAVDLQVTDSDDILHICSLNPTQEIQPGTFNVANTGQVIERIAADDVTGVDFNVLQQRMSIKEEQDPDDDRSDYDMSFGGSVVTTNIGLHKSTDNTYGQGHRWYYSPQIGEAVKERPENLLVALYYGMCREIRWAAQGLLQLSLPDTLQLRLSRQPARRSVVVIHTDGRTCHIPQCFQSVDRAGTSHA